MFYSLSLSHSASMASMEGKTGAVRRLTVAQVADTIAQLMDRSGSRFKDIRNALCNGTDFPTSFQVKAALHRGCKNGVLDQNNNGRFCLKFDKPNNSKQSVPSKSELAKKDEDQKLNKRRRSRKRKGKKAKKGKKGGKRRRRRRKGKKGRGKKGKKGKGRKSKKGRRGRRGRKGKKSKKR